MRRVAPPRSPSPRGGAAEEGGGTRQPYRRTGEDWADPWMRSKEEKPRGKIAKSFFFFFFKGLVACCHSFFSIYASMIYTAPCIMFWMRAYPLRGQVGGGWALEFSRFLGPVKWHQADRRVPFGAHPPSPPPPSRTYYKSTANCKVHKGTHKI